MTSGRLLASGLVLAFLLCTPLSAAGQLNEHCVVSILNRTAQVRADGSWQLPNVPAGLGPVRARATCVENGITTSGESEPFTIVAGRMNGIPPIVLGPTTPIPTSLAVAGGSSPLTQTGQALQLLVTANYTGGTTKNVTAATAGTGYTTTNAGIATVSADGLVTAVRSGTVIIRATNEGTAGLLAVKVQLGGDADGDGIPDDIEIAAGLNPNNPVDALEDADRDGLSNRDEYDRGTQILVADSDGDGIMDGEEVVAGVDGFITNPLLADTDGDGVRDGLEITSGSDPTNPASVNFGAALTRIEVAPTSFVLTVNGVIGEASQQLAVTGFLKDGTTLNLTSTLRGTNYTSSNLNICNFGAPDGRVFAGSNGPCTITVTNSGFTAQSLGTVQSFAPVSLSFVAIPGFANNVDVSGDYAYVAAGATGLQVVSVSNHSNPVVVAALDTPGNANDVVVVGNYAYVADGSAGLRIIDISNPVVPVSVGSLDTADNAWDVVVRDDKAYVADGASGFRIIDVSIPAAPKLLGSIDPAGTQKGVDVDVARNLAVLASGTSGIQVVNIANPAAPVVVGTVSTAGDARDVAIKDNFAIVADYSRSMTTVDLTSPTAPVVRASTPQSLGGLLQDVTVAGRFGIGADVLFVNGVPIVDLSNPASPIPRAILNFGNFRDDNGTGIAADSSFVYLTAETGLGTENGTTGNTRLYIGQYLAREDRGGVPPTLQITSPVPGTTFFERASIPVRVTATDDIAVVGVNFLVNGQVVFTDTTAPFEFSVVAPVGTSTVVLGATAIDLGNNVGTAADITVNVIPDPLTLVQGIVVSRLGVPQPNASIVCQALTGISGPDGRFSIPGVPTALGSIQCSASVVSGGVTLTGLSGLIAPVPAGVTDVGQVVVQATTSRGRDFWLANQQLFAPGAQIILTSDAAATYSITGGGFSATGTVTPQTPAVIALPVSVQINGNQVIENKGLHITSSGDIGVAMFFTAGSATEMYLGLPTPVLGTEYLVVAYEDSLPARGFSGGASEFVIVGTQATTTTVNITPSCNSLTRVAGQQYSIQLGLGQTYQYQCFSFTDVTGTKIVSDQPVAVIGGNACVDIPRGTPSCNPLAEMLFPTTTLYGTEHYSAPLAGAVGTLTRVMASQDGTVLNVNNGVGQSNFNLNRGQFVDIFPATGSRFTSNLPVSVTQYLQGGGVNADPFQMQLVPTHAWKEAFRFYSPGGFSNSTIIIAPNAAVASVKLNGVAVTAFQALPGGTHQYRIIAVPTGQNVVTADLPISVSAIGFGNAQSYGYPGGL